jgi:hypothetical protein
MKITRIACTLAQTINTGNYSSFRVEWTEEAEPVEGEDLELIRWHLEACVRDELRKQIRRGPERT